MTARVLTPKNQIAYDRAFAECKNVVNDAYDALYRHGAESNEFATMAAARAMLWSRMRELQGLPPTTWNERSAPQSAAKTSLRDFIRRTS
jgi:hypothetical protein